jgi:MerR family transcriptional regulator, thiopeptide resistance regulator
MTYTAGEVEKISGVKTHTLRYYDKIGLLKPAYYSDNGYRQYEKEQLLQLQQILFFKEMGFTLESVVQLLKSNNLDRLLLLSIQKQEINKKIKRLKSLTQTIDKTILDLKGKLTIKDDDLFNGLTNRKIIELKAFAKSFLGKKPDEFIDKIVSIEKTIANTPNIHQKN